MAGNGDGGDERDMQQYLPPIGQLLAGDRDFCDEEDVFSPVGWVMGVPDTGDGQPPLSHTTPNLLQNHDIQSFQCLPSFEKKP